MSSIRLFIFSTLSLLGIAGIAFGQFGREEGTVIRHDEGVRISFDPHVVLTKKILGQLASSPAVQNAAIRDVTGKVNEQRLDSEDYLLLNGERIEARVTLTVDNDQTLDKGLAFGELHAFLTRTSRVAEHRENSSALLESLVKQYHEAARKRLEQTLDAITRREFEKQLDRESQSVERERALADEALAGVREKRQTLQKTSTGLPQRVLEETVSNLQKQQQALGLDAAGLKARADAVSAQVAKSAEELKSVIPDDAVQKHLERLLQLRMDQMTRLRELHRQGAVPSTEISKAEEDVALAQINLAQGKRDAGKAVSDRIDKLNSELAQIAVERSEAAAKAKFVEEHLAQAEKELQTEINSAQPLREEISAESAAAQQMALEARKLEADFRRLKASYLPARVQVIDLTPKDDNTANPQNAKP